MMQIGVARQCGKTFASGTFGGRRVATTQSLMDDIQHDLTFGLMDGDSRRRRQSALVYLQPGPNPSPGGDEQA